MDDANADELYVDDEEPESEDEALDEYADETETAGVEIDVIDTEGWETDPAEVAIEDGAVMEVPTEAEVEMELTGAGTSPPSSRYWAVGSNLYTVNFLSPPHISCLSPGHCLLHAASPTVTGVPVKVSPQKPV